MIKFSPPKITFSGRDIVVPDFFPAASSHEAFLQDLRALEERCEGLNKHQKVLVLITGCILSDINTRGQIMAVMQELDYKGGHIAITLKENTGSNPETDWWKRDEAGRYSAYPFNWDVIETLLTPFKR